MTEYHSVKVKLYSQVDKLKSAAKNVTDITLTSSSGMIGNDENNFPHNLLLTNRHS